jgi:hypothetical protein
MTVEKIGTTKLWIGTLDLGEHSFSIDQLQNIVTDYAKDTKRTVTGGFLVDSNRLVLLHWPETREGYIEQSIYECELVLEDLKNILEAVASHNNDLADDEVSCMMGLKVGGYGDGRVASLDELSDYKLELQIDLAHMVSARAKHDGTVESYGEPTVFLTGKSQSESTIHSIGDQLEQYHYAIQRGSGVTDFYETRWVNEA